MKRIILLGMVGLLGIMTACSAKTSRKDGNGPQESKAAGSVQVLDTEGFLEKIYDYRANSEVWQYKGELPCIIDFYADWCRPCRMLAPIMEELAAKYRGKIVIYKINVDQEKELSTAFGIQSIPSLLFVPVEGTPAMQAGVLPKEQLEQYIESFLLGKNPSAE